MSGLNWTEDEYQAYLERRKAEAREKASKKPAPQPYIKEISKVDDVAENEMIIKFTVPINPVTKKNHSRIVTSGKRCPVCKKGEYYKLLPSKQYDKYECKIAYHLRKLYTQIGETIGYPINLECHFYCDTHRQSDLVGHLQAIQDLLVKYKCLEDDCRDIVASTDGSVVLYDKENPRTEIIITKKENYEQWAKKRKSSK